MARKTITVEISKEGRDLGKRFLITEMPATKAEKWAARALNALLASGIQISDQAASAGMRGLAAAVSQGLSGFTGLPWNLVEPLLDEMMDCVQVLPNPSNPGIMRPLIEQDIEEVVTRLTLRNAWLELHIGFSFAAESLTSASVAGSADRSNT